MIHTTESPHPRSVPRAVAAPLLLALLLALQACAPPGTVIEVGKEGNWRSGWAAQPQVSETLGLTTRPYVSGLERPVEIRTAGDGTGRLFVVQQEGSIALVDGGELLETPFLDIRERVGCCGERGLLGFAAHPDFARNGRFFVSYTDVEGTSVLARFEVGEDPDRADPASETVLLEVPQPGPVHNGGQIGFGPDGHLYYAIGEGEYTPDWLGSSRRAQDPRVLLGKVLRLDVDAASPYAIPADNPFAGDPDARGEIWAWGLRNPWRFHVDPPTGDLYIADVGQTAWEEINVLRADAGPNERNFGWPYLEGPACRAGARCDSGAFTAPILAYTHDEGCATTGGYVYRGEDLPELRGTYLYGDFCSGKIWQARDVDGRWESRELFDTDTTISTFGVDEQGEILFADFATGVLYRIEAVQDR